MSRQELVIIIDSYSTPFSYKYPVLWIDNFRDKREYVPELFIVDEIDIEIGPGVT
jgi:hypothetical protein